MNDNGNYIDQLFEECKKYDQCQSKFEDYFASLKYENAKDLKSFTDQLELIKELLLGDAKEILQCQYDGNNNPKWVDVNNQYATVYIFLQQKAGMSKDQQQNKSISFSNGDTNLNSEKKKFADNMKTIREKLFSNIDVSEENWFKSEDFKKNAFEVIKQFPDFQENLRSDFFQEHSVNPEKPKVNFWQLIISKDFFHALQEYFSKNAEERKTHKLKMLFKFIEIDLIGKPKHYGNHSTAYRYILGEKAYEDIPAGSRLPIFCSLVEFYGKNFFDLLPEAEQETVKKFYLKNKLGFQLSDPSIVGNDNEVLKIDDLNLDSGIKLNESDNNIKNNLNGLKDRDEIVKKNIGGDNGAKMREKTKSNYHIGKIIFFGLLAIGVGFLFGWLYALIPVALLIVLAILDHKFNFLPGPKKIFYCTMPCLSCLQETKEQDKNPEQDDNVSMKDTEIEN